MLAAPSEPSSDSVNVDDPKGFERESLLPPSGEGAEPNGSTPSAVPKGELSTKFDALQTQVRDALRAFAAGESVGLIEPLFEVSLDDQAAVRQRVAELEARVKRGDSGELTALRLDMLRELASVTMAEPTRRVLTRMSEPERALRDVARAIESLEAPLLKLANALDERIAVARSGGMLGFRADVERWADAAELLRLRLRRSATDARRSGAELLQQATQIEGVSRSRRQRFFSSVMRADQEEIDAVFKQAIAEERDNRPLRASLEPTQIVEGVEIETRRMIEQRDRLERTEGTSSAFRSVAAIDSELDSVDQLVLETRDLDRLFRQASAREAVAVFDDVASQQARSEAYELGAELMSDLASDFAVLRRQLRDYTRERRRELQSLAGMGLGALSLLGAALIGAFAVWLRPRTPRIVSIGVRQLARSSLFRGQVGGLVRWAGLFHAIAPVIVVGIAGYAIVAILEPVFWEARFLEIAFRWLVLFAFGQALLIGATRRVSAGRPALVETTPETVRRLKSSYNQVGWVAAIGAIIEETVRTLLVLGRLREVIEIAVALWFAAWLFYACWSWRVPVAHALGKRFGEGSFGGRLAGWMSRRRLGFVAVGPAVVWLAVRWLLRGIRFALLEQGVFAYFKARALRRQSMAAAQERSVDPLPDEYAKEFPLYPMLGDDGHVRISRPSEIDPIVEQFKAWQSTRRDSSVALVGDKGVGKTTLLGSLGHRLIAEETHFCTLTERLVSEGDVVRVIASVIGSPSIDSFSGLLDVLNSGPERVIIVDDAHLSFLRVVDGYRGFDALVRLVNVSGERVFWILSFNDFAWSFLNAAHGGRAYFRQVRRIKRWSSDELRDLIARRSRKAGYELEFDEQLLDDDRIAGEGIRLIEGADGFFRLLWESSRGNPRVATSMWLRSLTGTGEKVLRVGLFASGRTDVLSDAGDDVFFALAAITQHENLTTEELQETLNVDPSFAAFVLTFLRERQVIGPKFGAADRHTVKVRHYWNVVQTLRSRNLLYLETA